MYLRSELSCWAHEDPLARAFALEGELLRAMPARRSLRVEFAGRPYVLKLHFGVGWREIAKNVLSLRMPVLGAGNELRALTRLHAAGVPTMQVAAFGARGCNPATRRSFILLDHIEHHASLETLVRRWRQQPPTMLERRRLLLQVARIARGMHAAGVNHRDFYLCHFLCTADGSLRLIDLHRAGVRRWVPLRWRLKDLASLYFSAMDAGLSQRECLRFIRSYEGRLPRTEHTRRFWRSVELQAASLYGKAVRLGIVG